MEQLDRQIQLALKPVGSDRDGEEAGEQQEQRQEKDARREAPAADDLQRHIPARLRQIADASGGRIVIGACRPARTMIFHPKKSNYKRESLAFYLCKAFPFHRLSVSRSECLFLIRTKRRCGRHSRGRPPGPRSSCWSGGSGRKSGRGKEGSPPAVSGLPGEYRREMSRGAGRKTRRYGTPQKTGTSHDAPAT